MLILVVDDRPMNNALVVAALTPEHVVEVCENGADGLDRAVATRFDLIILDIEMPGLRGDEVCARLRAAGHREPILALTSSVLASELAKLEYAGFDLVLTKPIDPDELRNAVRQFRSEPSQ